MTSPVYPHSFLIKDTIRFNGFGIFLSFVFIGLKILSANWNLRKDYGRVREDVAFTISCLRLRSFLALL